MIQFFNPNAAVELKLLQCKGLNPAAEVLLAGLLPPLEPARQPASQSAVTACYTTNDCRCFSLAPKVISFAFGKFREAHVAIASTAGGARLPEQLPRDW